MDPAVPPTPNPDATLTGIPTELRLHIYSYLEPPPASFGSECRRNYRIRTIAATPAQFHPVGLTCKFLLKEFSDGPATALRTQTILEYNNMAAINKAVYPIYHDESKGWCQDAEKIPLFVAAVKQHVAVMQVEGADVLRLCVQVPFETVKGASGSLVTQILEKTGPGKGVKKGRKRDVSASVALRRYKFEWMESSYNFVVTKKPWWVVEMDKGKGPKAIFENGGLRQRKRKAVQ